MVVPVGQLVFPVEEEERLQVSAGDRYTNRRTLAGRAGQRAGHAKRNWVGQGAVSPGRRQGEKKAGSRRVRGNG